MELSAALRLARAGRALLFLGAGFSSGTPNGGSGEMRSGQGFSDLLGGKVDLPAGTSLTYTSEAYLEQYGAVALASETIMEFTATGLLTHQLQMASVPWKQIYTVSSVPHGQAVCIHLNGSITGLTSANLASQIRLTDSSYLTSSLSESEWAIRLRQDIDAAQAVFYIGYSTYDLDIARLLIAKPSLKDKSFFVVGAAPSAILQLRIDKFGTDTKMGATEFFEELIKPDYAPSGKLPLPETCVRTYSPSPAHRVFSDRDMFDLFMVGRLAESFVFDSITGRIQYVAHRKILDRVLGLIDKPLAAVAVHSNLGNGKTVFLQMVKIAASIAGFSVVELVRQKDALFEELDAVLKRGGKLLILIDNYGDWQDAIGFIGKHHSRNLSVVIAARSATNDVLASRMQANLDLGELSEISLDKLQDDDLLRVSGMMDAYGLWQDKASWPLRRKLQHLTNHCGREWQAILIELFKSPQIKDRLDRLIAGIKAEKTYNSVLIAILILAIIDHPATTDILTDLCGESTLTVGFRQNVVIQELISFEADDVRLKSAVTGAFILRRVADPELTLETLKAITRAADRAASVSREVVIYLTQVAPTGCVRVFWGSRSIEPWTCRVPVQPEQPVGPDGKRACPDLRTAAD
jgi:hypothetical protein